MPLTNSLLCRQTLKEKLAIIHGSQAICLFIKSAIIAPHVRQELAMANNLIK